MTNERGPIYAKILGDLGPNVLEVERHGEDPARNIGPFFHNIPHPEKSLFWRAFNNSKRNIALDIETADGQAFFKKLVEMSDVV